MVHAAAAGLVAWGLLENRQVLPLQHQRACGATSVGNSSVVVAGGGGPPLLSVAPLSLVLLSAAHHHHNNNKPATD